MSQRESNGSNALAVKPRPPPHAPAPMWPATTNLHELDAFLRRLIGKDSRAQAGKRAMISARILRATDAQRGENPGSAQGALSL